MTTSADRTITITSSGQKGLSWPLAQPTDDLDYSITIASLLTATDDAIHSVAVDMAPSGSGEATISDLAVSLGVITIQIAGGVAGRFYVCRFVITTTNSETYEFLVQYRVSSATAPYPRVPPPSEDYGTELSFMSTRGSSSALEGAHLLSSAACYVLSVQANATTTGGWVMLLNAASVPSDGAVAPVMWWQLQAGSTLAPDAFIPPIRMTAGAVLAFSTAPSPFVLAKSATATFAWEVTT